MNLKQFMVRQEVLKLYRSFFRVMKECPDVKQRSDVIQWVKADFKANKNIDPANEEQIKSLLYQGQKMLNELKQNVDLSKA